jgi:hypothetical protein
MSDPIDRPETERREFDRTPVRWPARVKPLDEEQAAALERELRSRPSVWQAAGESKLRDLAHSAPGSPAALLAETILDLSAEIARLHAKQAAPDRDLRQVDVLELSADGGRLATPLPLRPEDLLEIRFEPDRESVSPIQALIRIVHRCDQPEPAFGFTYVAIHNDDRARLRRLTDATASTRPEPSREGASTASGGKAR